MINSFKSHPVNLKQTILHTVRTQLQVLILIDNERRLRFKLYRKQDDFHFLIVNFPFQVVPI
jgi:hypothetical protein